MSVRVTTAWTYRGLRTVVLENRLLRLVVLPEAGAKIWQISYKPYDTDLLWNNPRIADFAIRGDQREAFGERGGSNDSVCRILWVAPR